MATYSPFLSRFLGLVPYQTIWQHMRDFTETRSSHTWDEIWFLEHPPTFTLGQAGKPEHILQTTDIPLYQTDRGGQVTYHGPGQLVIYTLLDLTRLQWSVRDCVFYLEQAMIDSLQTLGILANRRAGAPGIYIDQDKIGAVGLRVRHGRTYHGISLNVDMDLTPFQYIHPCGYPDLSVTHLRAHGIQRTPQELAVIWRQSFQSLLAKR